VANKPGGLNGRNGDDLETPSAMKSLERIDAGSRPIGGTWGRPMTSGKKQARAPDDPPGSWPRHPGTDLQRERREGPSPSRGWQQPAQTAGYKWGHEILVEGGGLAHEPVGARTKG
jgi:hypothetical protein